MTRSIRRILYIQHANSLGGSCKSLLFLIQGLDRSRYEPVVACISANPRVLELYEKEGIQTLYWPGISGFDHTDIGWAPIYHPLAMLKFLKQLWCFYPSITATKKLIEQVQPDIVHLNSLVLAPSAVGAQRAGVPVVWHVREPVHPGHVGLRRWFLSQVFVRAATEGIFISQYDRHRLTGGKKGEVVHNFVDFQMFDYGIDGASVRAELGLSTEAKVILFLGGQSTIKGIFPLLEAFSLIRKAVPETHLVMGNGVYVPSGRLVSRIARTILPVFGSGTVSQRVDRIINLYKMQDCVHLLPWRNDIPQLFAASNVLVFPSIRPHFARPVIEAGAMKKPIVASRIGGVEELAIHGKTGLLVKPRDVGDLAQALTRILFDQELASRMGDNGYLLAKQRFDAKSNIEATMAVYEQLFSDSQAGERPIES